jgi:putative transposase
MAYTTASIYKPLKTMPRAARVVIPGVAHHLTQRGNNRQDVFLEDEDFANYLRILKRKAEKYCLEVLGYCLMSNHVHLIGTPREAESLAKAFGRTNYSYANYYNEKYEASGHLWQSRFFSCPLDQEHFWHALSYIERNPVRIGFAGDPWKYGWSSAAAHVGEDQLDELINLRDWERISKGVDWRLWLSRPEGKQVISKIKRHTLSGRPLGSDEFIDSLEVRTGRRLRALPIGRPRLI